MGFAVSFIFCRMKADNGDAWSRAAMARMFSSEISASSWQKMKETAEAIW